MLRRHRSDSNQSPIVDILRRLGAYVAITSQVGGGFTDLVVGFRGVTYIVEVKYGDDWDYTPAQKEFRKDWKGGPIVTLASVDDAVTWLQRIARASAPR
jgi:hypothetical protein